MSKSEQLKSLIEAGKTSEAIELVRSEKNYGEAEELVFTVLDEEKSAPELVDAVLESFLNTRENRYQQHGYWVHSLSHFTGKLWVRRMVEWIKKFNEVSFKGANELRDSNCSSRLVNDFGQYAQFNDDPAEFHLTPENLSWMNWKYSSYAKARIEAGRFESEEAFLRWKLRQPEVLTSASAIHSAVQRLQEIGADTSEFDGLEKNLLTAQLKKLEEKLSTATDDWDRKQAERGIEETREALANL